MHVHTHCSYTHGHYVFPTTTQTFVRSGVLHSQLARCYSNYASSSPSSNSTIALSAASCSVFRCFLRALFSLDFRSSRTALRAPPPACVGETRVVFILSKLTAREVANSVVGSSQLVAPLLSDQLIGVAQAHAEHRLDVAECWHDRVDRTAACKPCLAPMLPFAFWHL